MGADDMRMMELLLQGFGCSQILMILALEAQGKENSDLVRAISGLHGGFGYSGKICGALSGGCCVLALHCGRGAVEEIEDTRLNPMIGSLVGWFEDEYRTRYGGIDCSDILEQDPRNRLTRCPAIIRGVHDKIVEILNSRSA